MNAYAGQLTADTHLTVSQQGAETQITLTHQQAGQQQAQSNSFATGSWRVPPLLFRTAAGYVLRLEGDRPWLLHLQARGMQVLSTPPDLSQAEVVPLQAIATPSQTPMQPMQPMQPLKMGTMSMQMQPMTMQMGDMKLAMGDSPPATPSQHRFCPQCGQGVTPGDRFCSACGHQLQA